MYQFMHFLHEIQGYTLIRTDNKLTILSVAGVQVHVHADVAALHFGGVLVKQFPCSSKA
jgi:hypothetical protein